MACLFLERSFCEQTCPDLVCSLELAWDEFKFILCPIVARHTRQNWFRRPPALTHFAHCYLKKSAILISLFSFSVFLAGKQSLLQQVLYLPVSAAELLFSPGFYFLQHIRVNT